MFVPVLEHAPPAPALYVFPHAGATAATLASFGRASSGLFRVHCVDLPGRLERIREPVRTDFPDLVEDLAGALAAELGHAADRPYALLGVCGGAYLALEVVRTLRRARVRLPAALAVVSASAPDVARQPHRVADLPSEVLWEQLARDDGVPPQLASNPSFRRLAEPAVRADFALFADYRYRPQPPLELPIVALHGARDLDLRRGAVLGWQRQSVQPLWPVVVPDAGRWLLDESPDAVCQALAEVVPGVGPAPGAG